MTKLSTDLDRGLRLNQRAMARASVKELLKDQSRAGLGLTVDAPGEILIDFSKQPLNAETMGLLGRMCREADVVGQRTKMVAGETINAPEGREVLHMALRSPKNDRLYYDHNGLEVSTDIHKVLDNIQAFCDQVYAGLRTGSTGERFETIINIGIGGSDLGPRMVVEALSPYADQDIEAYFVSNVDPSDLAQTLNGLDPETTLVIVASKTFTTQETLTNAKAARDWLEAALGTSDVDAHFVAVTAAPDKAAAFGIEEEAIFPFWDWVGGRYSLWSAIGLPIALTLGFNRFRALLDGAHEMDEHFITSPFQTNAPMIMGALSYYHRNYCSVSSHAVLPYDQNMEALPSYLQQLEMESNGKSVLADGSECDVATSPVIWGAAGTNAQHSFFQLLHQSKDTISMDLLAAAKSHTGNQEQHNILLANFLAQGRAFMEGQDKATAKTRMLAKGMSDAEAELAAQHSQSPGNRPVTSIIYPKLTPFVLGALIALYEHRVFVQGMIAGINPFDQWGVELGKVLAKEILPALQSGKQLDLDASTSQLMQQLKVWQAR